MRGCGGVAHAARERVERGEGAAAPGEVCLFFLGDGADGGGRPGVCAREVWRAIVGGATRGSDAMAGVSERRIAAAVAGVRGEV